MVLLRLFIELNPNTYKPIIFEKLHLGTKISNLTKN
jgi:hypothetical protein